jgi:hypothetical protein
MKKDLYIISQLYALKENHADGYSSDMLSQAEQKLRIQLPDVLRSYYLVLGRNNNINTAFNRLLAPDEWYMVNGHFIFYEENQAVAKWGIRKEDLSLPDPPVYGSYDQEAWEWFLDADTSQYFLRSMAYWNAALGGLEYTAMKNNPAAETIAFIENNWKEQSGITKQYLRFFTNDHKEIIVFTTDEVMEVNGLYIATNDEYRFKKLMDTLSVQWDCHS